MLYSNSKIIQSNKDLCVGGITIENDDKNMSYANYIHRVKSRILSLVIKYTQNCMKDGNPLEDAISQAAGLIHSYLYIPDKEECFTEEDLVNEICKSDEFKIWRMDIYYNFQNYHPDKVDNNTEIPTEEGGFNKDISDEKIRTLENDDSLMFFLEALSPH